MKYGTDAPVRQLALEYCFQEHCERTFTRAFGEREGALEDGSQAAQNRFRYV